MNPSADPYFERNPDARKWLYLREVARGEYANTAGKLTFKHPGDGDDPLHQNSAGYLWRITRDKAGAGFRLHDLRHYYASGLIAAGCDVVTVQRAMGHGAASLTLNTYSHLRPRAEDRTRNAAAQMLTEALTADQLRTQQQLSAW